MASPYQGQGDDFDIDIDIMDDQGSHMDSDMMGADDYPTSQPSLFPHDANNDADMVDEPSEGSMVDADDYVEGDHDIEVRDEEVTYEAEMQEGDQDVNVDAPEIPTIQVEVAADENTLDKDVLNLTEPVGQSESQDGSADLARPSSAELQPGESPDQAQDVSVEPNEAEAAEPEQPPVTAGDQAEAATQKVERVEQKHEITESKEPGTENPHAQGEPAAENLNAPGVESDAHEAKYEHAEHDSHYLHEAEDHDHQNDETLHPVKVLYQENEISLFPPLEGDSAETFFLHDEDVAYDSVGKLFSSLREVLMDNVAENEVLVIDIDSLGIQITEVSTEPGIVLIYLRANLVAQDSSYNSKVTLHQILDVYLRLCHNDGTNEPEALYLTLSSKLAVNSELTALDAAANEGKGLSHIHTWDDYDDEIPAEEKAPNVQEAPGPDEEEVFVDETEPGQPVSESHEDAPAQEPLAHESHDADDAEEAQGEAVSGLPTVDHQPQAEAEAEVVTEQISEVQHEEKEVTQEYHEGDEAQTAHEDDQFEDHYDSEAHNTESSATLANEHAEDGYGHAVEGTEDHHGTGDQGDEDTNREDFDQEQNGADELGGPDSLQDDFAQEDDWAEKHPDNDETAHENEPFHEAGAQFEAENAPGENVAGDVGDTSHDQSEPTLQNAAQQDAADEDRPPEPEDENFGTAEDWMQTPAKDHDQDQHTEGVDHELYEEDEDANEGELAAPSAEQDDGDDFDDYYPPPDLEVKEAIELGGTDVSDTDPQPHDNLSTKRSREEDEEWDIAATTTPETKRRRS